MARSCVPRRPAASRYGVSHPAQPMACGGRPSCRDLMTALWLTSVAQLAMFGGDTLTATDVACAAGRADLGQRKLVADLPPGLVTHRLARVSDMIAEGVDRMKTE